MKQPTHTTSIKMNNRLMTKKVTKSSTLQAEQSDEEYLKLIETTEFQKRANTQMNEIVNRFLTCKKKELKLENFNDEEVEKIIEHMLNNENNDYDGYSSNEDDDSIYSDEESF
jgi:hypothetical protein